MITYGLVGVYSPDLLGQPFLIEHYKDKKKSSHMQGL